MVLLTALVALTVSAPADSEVTSLMVFKNGYGFVSERAEIVLEEGWAEIPEAPQASFGLLWLGVPEAEHTIDRAISTLDERVEAAEVTSVDELLAANEGARVTLLLTPSAGQEQITGTLGKPLASIQPRPYTPAYGHEPPSLPYAVPPSSYLPPTPPPATEFITLVGDDGETTFVPRQRVQSIQFEEPPRRTRSQTTQVPRMRALVTRGDQPATGRASIHMTYMRKGVTWLPSYRVARLDDGTARLRLDATLINDAADLEGTDVGFIVGVPNFILQDMLSPASVRMAWQGLSPYFGGNAEGAGGYSQVMVTQMANVAPMRAAEAPQAPGPNPMAGHNVGAGAQEDLFVYQVEDVDLPKGGRGLFKVFEQEAPYEDVYLLTLEEDLSTRFSEVTDRIEDPDLLRALQRPDVWHALRLENTSDGPWTTGAATALSPGGLAVGQSMLTFTPPGSTADLKLTVAPDVTAEREEQEIGRELEALTVRHTTWNRVTLKGVIKLSNTKDEDARVIVRRRVVGEFTEVSEPGTFSAVATSAYSVNPTSEAVWDVTVPKGDATELNFVYNVYVRY